MEKVFIKALPVLRILIEAGHQAYFVGGAVRDSYMKRTIGDVDIATDAAPDQVERLFQRTVDVGKEHGTIMCSGRMKPMKSRHSGLNLIMLISEDRQKCNLSHH